MINTHLWDSGFSRGNIPVEINELFWVKIYMWHHNVMSQRPGMPTLYTGTIILFCVLVRLRTLQIAGRSGSVLHNGDLDETHVNGLVNIGWHR